MVIWWFSKRRSLACLPVLKQKRFPVSVELFTFDESGEAPLVWTGLG